MELCRESDLPELHMDANMTCILASDHTVPGARVCRAADMHARSPFHSVRTVYIHMHDKVRKIADAM